MIALLMLAMACNDPVVDAIDSGEPPVDDTDEQQGCDELVLDPLGPADPIVGDEWTVWLRCDGTTLMGATVLQFDPPEFASVDENVATFLMAGTATMKLQVGSYREEMDVTVTEGHEDTGR